MSINNLNTYLNIKDSHLRVVSGNVYAQAMNIGGINVETAHGLQSVSNTGNVTSNTLQFSNAITGFVTTANAQIGRDLVVSGNTTVSTDLTVSANATVADTLTISEHVIASKEATVTGNLHVTTIRSDSNVVTEYTGPHDRPLRKYPEVALTANDNSTTSGYVASTNNKTTGTSGVPYRDAFMAYDGFFSSQNATWQTLVNSYDSNGDDVSGDTFTAGGTNYVGHWNKLQIPNSIKVEKIEIIAYVNGTDDQRPDQGAFLGSTDGTNWELIYSFSSGTLSWSESGDASGIRKITTITDITNTNRYNYLVLVVEKIPSASAATQLGVAELRYYGHEEGSGSLDTTLKTVYNVPATTGTQLEVYYDAKGLDNGNAPTNPVDLSPNTNNATLGGDPQVSNGAFVFDGTGDYITGTHGLSVPGQPVHSQCVWFKITGDTSDYQYISIIGTSNPTNQAGLVLLNDGTTLLGNYYGGERVITTITQNVWYHAVLVYTGTTTDAAKYYINGVEVITTGLSGAAPITPTITGTTVRLGANTSGGQELNGSIANFRLYSKALNADQVKELYDYQKDYFLGSKSQVTLYKGHLGVGVTEPSGQLELAGDERIQEYPPRAFDGGVHAGEIGPNEVYIEGHGHFKAWTTGSYPDNRRYEAGGAFTKTSGVGTQNFDRWVSGQVFAAGPNASSGASTGLPTASAPTFAGYKGAHLILELPYAINLKSFNVTVSAETSAQMLDHTSQLPSVFVIIASNDGNNWDTIFNHTATAGVASDYAGTNFIVNVPETYSQFGFVALKQGNTSGGDHVSVGEWRLFGTPGPTTLDKGSLTLGRSLDVPRVSRYDVDTETPRPEKLVLDFDTTVNSSPTDISGKGNHGRFVGTAQYSAADKAFTGFPSSSSNYIKATLNGASGAYAHTQSYWINGADTTPRVAFTVGTNTGTYSYLYMWLNTSKWVMSVDGFGFQYVETIDDNRWYHITVTYDGGSVQDSYKFYLNGEYKTPTSVDNASSFNSLNLPSNPEVRIGRDENVQWYNGMVSNPKIYSVALEASEVKKLYNLGRTGRSMVISDTAVGIGKAPEAQLDVRGNLNVDGVITTPQRPVFYAYHAANGGATHGGSGTTHYTANGYTGMIRFKDTKINVGNCFNTSDYKFYAPITGYYWFEFTALARYGTGNGHMELTLVKNGVNAAQRSFAYAYVIGNPDHDFLAVHIPLFCNAGDNIYPSIHAAAPGVNLYFGEELGHFSGYFIG
jgi:hypothetical protein